MTTIYEDKANSSDLLGQSRALRGRIDESLMKEVKELGQSAILGIFLSATGYLILGVLLYFIFLRIAVSTRIFNILTLSLGKFFIFYTIIIAILMVVGMYFVPKEEYYTGTRSAFFLGNDPFTLRDDKDRMHASLGFLLVVPNFIRMNAVYLHNYLTSAKQVKNSALAAAILLLCEEGRPPAEMLQTLQGIGFGETTVKQAAGFLQKVDWLEVGKDKETAAPLLQLTNKGDQVLKDARNFI
ncbi:MAG: hypothetical protein KAT34_12350 [Candidatus Aminicenantes bacterium]|nr:hypothetical protein [Candidatus Aminicenantes bacterium]